MLNILVTGASGQLGSEIKSLSSEFPAYYFFAERSDLDISDKEALNNYIQKHAIDTVINCAAYTAVDKAESDEVNADNINHLAVRHMAEIAKERGIKLIHISTDYVFDGTGYKPYNEDDAVGPNGVYGKTKLDGEKALQNVNPKNSIIIRTSWVYSSFGANFVKTMLRLGKERESLSVIFDQVGTPTYAGDLAKAILQIIPVLENESVEVYHYSNEGVTSWYDFAMAIFELSGVACQVNAIETKAYPTPAARPHYSLLNKSKIKETFNIAIPYWKDSLQLCVQRILDEGDGI